MSRFSLLEYKPSRIRSYGIAVLSIGAALVVSRWAYPHRVYPGAFFIVAVMLSAWFGGVGPGLLATALSSLAFHYFFRPSTPSLINYTITHLLVGLMSAAASSAKESLRDARDELKETVRNLLRTNDALNTESREREQAENRLRHSEAYLAEAQQLSRTGSFGWDVSSSEIYWSRETFRIFEIEPTGIVTVDLILQRTHPEDRMAVQQLIERVTRQRTAFDFEHRLLMPDGSVKYVHVVGRPSQNESGLLEFVGAVSDVTAVKLVHEKLRLAFQQVSELRDRLQLLLNLTNRITSSLDLREVLRAVAASIRDVMHADAVAVSQPDATSGKFRLIAVDFPHGKGVLKEELLVNPSVAAKKALDTLKPAVFDERQRDYLGSEAYEVAVAEGIHAGCTIPLANRGRVLGFLSILRTTETPFTPEDVDLLTQASGQIAIAIDNAFAFQEVTSLGARLQMLLNLTNRITSNLEFRELLRAIAANIREVIHADAVTVTLREGTSENGRVFAVDFPHGKGVIKEELVLAPTTPIRKAIETLQPVVIDTRERDELAPETLDIVDAEGIKAFCCIPLVNHGRVLGILAISRTTETPFMPEDVDFLSRASGQIAIAIENALAYQEISELKDKLAQEKLYLEDEIRSEMGFAQIIGNSAALKHVLQLAETAAPSDSTVLLLGETGTGKELIARAIHDRSRRAQRTLVKLNCAAIPTGLLESELFGHEKGAFTGAITQKTGRLELADQGTLFLDEVGDIPIEIQPKLLRALQEREFERLGSTHTLKVNVRLIAATNRDLEKMVASKEFRSDLYYRLNVFPIRIPPLRDRKEDIPLLVSYFVQKFANEMQKRIEAIPVAVMKGLTSWDWPGNIRELENFIERAVLLTRGRSLEAPLTELQRTHKESSSQIRPHELKQVAGEEADSRSDKSTVLDEYARKQRDEIIQAITECKGRVGGADGAAARLGMNRTTLLARMKKFGIYAKQYA